MRILISLSVSQSLGPIISTIQYMFNDIKKFIIIWIIVVFMFTCVGMMAFQEIETLQTFDKGGIYWVNCALGDWDLEIFDQLIEKTPPSPYLRDYGIYLVIIYSFINVLILLNVVIAMMADTYALLSSVRQGVYNYSVLSIFSSYKLDKDYGGLIVFVYPYSIAGTLMLPFFCCIKNKQRL